MRPPSRTSRTAAPKWCGSTGSGRNDAPCASCADLIGAFITKSIYASCPHASTAAPHVLKPAAFVIICRPKRTDHGEDPRGDRHIRTDRRPGGEIRGRTGAALAADFPHRPGAHAAAEILQ